MGDKSSNLATLAANIKQGVEARLKELHTAMPGIIQSFDAATQLASVQPTIRRIFVTRDGDSEILIPSDLPILINVPVIYPRGGGFSFTFPVKQGDECLLVFCERSIDNWHETGKVKKPGARRFHSLSDATAFVGLSSVPNKIPTYDDTNLVLKKDDESVYIKIKENSDLDLHCDNNLNATVGGDASLQVTGDIDADCTNITVDATSTAVVTCPESTFNGNVTINGNLTTNGNIAATGTSSAPTVAATTSLTVAGKEMSGHTHSQGNDSAGNTEQNTGGPV